MSAPPNSTGGTRERDIFLGALDKTPAERGAYLDAVCGGDRDLRQRVADLLSEQDAIGGFLEAPALIGPTGTRAVGQGPHGTQVAGNITERPGDKIGRYKLLQVIGEGGCGVVYMAEQEEPVRRRVALKVIKLGMDTRSVIARFEAERQALAMMDHSNIARVFDAGATSTGRPFFVMELVRGIRITDYCDQNNLKNEERLALFIQVCQAIQHAHQKGIIHRDIKPSNILVTLHDGVPVPKVIDFGIAKATEQRLTEKTLFTEIQSFIGTPAYTSPEQAEMSGLDIDTRSDIYSLGVLLYELLTGRTPFDPDQLVRSGLDEMRRIIREEEPVRPSTRLSSLNMSEATALSQARQSRLPLLMQAVRGDLDWIVMRCLEKDRRRRYATANDLAGDIQRYLDNEPVLARPPSNVYRLQKMFRRNRGAFAAVAAVAITLVTGATVSTWLAIRATKAEQDARDSQKLEANLRRQAEKDRSLARLNEYVADINLAQQSLDDGNYGRAVQLLEKHQAIPGEQDLRGYEWRYLWQRSRGDAHIALPKQDSAVGSLAVSPDGQWMAVGPRERFPQRFNNRANDRFIIWNLRTHTAITNKEKGAISLAFFPDSKRLVSASSSTVRIWRTRDWSEDHALPDNSGPVSLSADGSHLATTTRGGVRVWDVATWKTAQLVPSVIGPFVLSPNGTTLAAETISGVQLFDVASGQPGVLLQDSTNLFTRPNTSTNIPPRPPRFAVEGQVLAFSPDGKRLAAARNTLSSRGVFVISVWDTATGAEVGSMPSDPEHIEHAGVITSLAFSPDGRTLASASRDYSVKLWDTTRLQPLATFHGHLSEVTAVEFLQNGSSLVSAAQDGEIKQWSAQPPQRIEIIPGLRHPQSFSPDGRIAAAFTRDNSRLVFLNLQTGEPDQQFFLEPREGRRGRPGRFGGPRFSPPLLSADLTRMAEADEEGAIKIIDTRTHDTATLEDPESPLELIALSPDGRTLVTRGKNWSLRVWDLPSGTNRIWRAEAFRAWFSPDNQVLATIGRSNVVQLWNASTLTPAARIEYDEQPAFTFFSVFVTAFSADSRLLAMAFRDDSIRIWDVATGKLQGVCTGHKQDIQSIAFAPDGRTLASSSGDSTVKLWNVATQQEVLTLRNLGTELSGLMFSPDGKILLGGSGALGPNGGLRIYRAASFSETDKPHNLTPAKD